MKTKHMLALGSVIPVIFWGTLTVCGYVLGAYPGLKQRFFHIGWSLWFIGLGRGFVGEGAGGD